MSRFTQLRDGKIIWSSTIREWLREHEKPDECIYCRVKGPLTTEHILPRSCGGPDIPDNAIRVCQSCNSGKVRTNVFIRSRGYRAGIFGDVIYATTCFVRNWVRTFSEKYFPTSPERMRSV